MHSKVVRSSLIVLVPESLVLDFYLLGLPLNLLPAAVANARRLEVAELGDGHEVVAALLAEAAPAVAAVLGLVPREGTAELCLALGAVVGEVLGDPDGGPPRAVGRRRLDHVG